MVYNSLYINNREYYKENYIVYTTIYELYIIRTECDFFRNNNISGGNEMNENS